MESCPHCNFLVPEGTSTCGVCHKPVLVAADEIAVPGFLAGEAARDGGPAVHHATPVALVALMALVLLFGAGAGVASVIWH